MQTLETSPGVTRVLVDCDPGIDDAFALLLALHHPRLDVVGVTTVAGNQPIETVSRNARNLLHLYGRSDVPLAIGEALPLSREQVTASSHGSDGLGGRVLPDSPVPEVDDPGVDFLIRKIREEAAQGGGSGLTIIAVGPLTNLARAIERDPEIVGLVREVVIMGGGEHAGNMTPNAEFNFFADPEAADATLAAGWPIRLCGLPLTWQSSVTAQTARDLSEMPGEIAAALSDWLGFYAEGETTPGGDGPSLHDAVAVAAVIDPSLVETEPVFSAVETSGRWTYGENIVDRDGSFSQPVNVQLGVKLDRDGFWNLLLSTIKTASEASPR